MMKPSSSSVLLLELEDLKEHMNMVQGEMGRCVTSLTVQSEEMCGVLARLETVTAIVKAVGSVDRNKTVRKICDPGPVLESFVDFNHDDLVAAECKEGYCAFREGEQHFPILGKLNEKKIDQKSDGNYRNEESPELNMNNATFTPESLINDNVLTSETTEKGLVASSDGADEGSVVEADKDGKNMNIGGNIYENLDNVLRSTRPSLSRNRRKNIKEKKNVFEDDIAVTKSLNSATVATKSVSSCLVPSSPKVSSPNSVTSGKTCSSSMVNSMSSMVNRVKEICSKQGWKVEGSYSTREGKEGCGMVHFYKLEVKGGVSDMLTRGVGVSKVEAVRRAFKTMENRLIGVDSELGRNIETVKRMQEELCDNNVNFPDEEFLLAVKYESRSEDSLSPPPLFHAKDCVAPDLLGVKESKDVKKRVHITIAVSNEDAGVIIGTKGANITSIRQEADVSILVEDVVDGRQDRLVKMWGTKASVVKAQKMIKEMIGK